MIIEIGKPPLSFLLRVFIFGAMIAYGVYITAKVWDHHVDFGAKGQIYLKSVFWFITRTSISFFDGVCLYLAMIPFGVKMTTKL